MDIKWQRFTDLPFPPYSYVPGQSPHPISDPAGHMTGSEHVAPAALDPSAWRNSTEYLYGVDLFNHTYYWESHEAWESLWHAAGRKGMLANFLKGLIKLAAAGVKFREGVPRGVYRHASRAAELLMLVAKDASLSHSTFCGIGVYELSQTAQALADKAAVLQQMPSDFEFPIKLRLN